MYCLQVLGVEVAASQVSHATSAGFGAVSVPRVSLLPPVAIAGRHQKGVQEAGAAAAPRSQSRQQGTRRDARSNSAAAWRSMRHQPLPTPPAMQDATEQFQQLQRIYSVLSDPDKWAAALPGMHSWASLLLRRSALSPPATTAPDDHHRPPPLSPAPRPQAQGVRPHGQPAGQRGAGGRPV